MSSPLPGIVPEPLAIRRGAGRPVRLAGPLRIAAPGALSSEAAWFRWVHLGRLAALDVNYRPLEGPTPGQARRWRTPAPPRRASA